MKTYNTNERHFGWSKLFLEFFSQKETGSFFKYALSMKSFLNYSESVILVSYTRVVSKVIWL